MLQGIANRRTGVAWCCRRCYLCEMRPSQSMAPRGSPLYLHSACTQRATLSLPMRLWTCSTALRSSTVVRSSKVVQAARSVGRTGPAGRLSLSLSLLAAAAVLAPEDRGRRCNRISQSRSCGSAGAAVKTGVGSPAWQSPSPRAAARSPLPRLVEKPSEDGQEGRSAQWHACTGGLRECEYMCFGSGGMCL
jgi:hypothetical protein